MKKVILLWAILLWVGIIQAQPADTAVIEPPQLMIRCDDIGMCHTVNMAAQQLLEKKIPFSASVMFVCPWYQEGVAILKEHPEIAVGVHLTLNAEWKNYRWGPVAGAGSVPSLVDSCGHFFPSRDRFFANRPKTEEVEIELRAQIERGLRSGLRIDYVDYHMGTAVSTPELRDLVEKLAKEYHLGISRYLGEIDAKSIYAVRPEAKTDSLAAIVSRLEAESISLAVFHIGLETPEMGALTDLNSFGLVEMSRHRHAELNALCSDELRSAVQAGGIRLITYRDLVKEVGLENMKAPVESDY